MTLERLWHSPDDEHSFLYVKCSLCGTEYQEDEGEVLEYQGKEKGGGYSVITECTEPECVEDRTRIGSVTALLFEAEQERERRKVL